MSNTKILELRTLDDEDLMDVVGGGQSQCHPAPRCQPRHCEGVEITIDVCVPLPCGL